jgi:hypothetical protein
MRLRLLGFIAMLFLGLIAFLLMAEVAPAQQISPILTECGGKKCSGQFTATNLNVTPVVVTIQAVSIRPGEQGKPLPSDVHLQLRDMAARIGPKGSHIFYFTATAEDVPEAFGIFATFTPIGQAPGTGVHITVSIGHGVWICAKANNCRVDIRKAWGMN